MAGRETPSQQKLPFTGPTVIRNGRCQTRSHSPRRLWECDGPSSESHMTSRLNGETQAPSLTSRAPGESLRQAPDWGDGAQRAPRAGRLPARVGGHPSTRGRPAADWTAGRADVAASLQSQAQPWVCARTCVCDATTHPGPHHFPPKGLLGKGDPGQVVSATRASTSAVPERKVFEGQGRGRYVEGQATWKPKGSQRT